MSIEFWLILLVAVLFILWGLFASRPSIGCSLIDNYRLLPGRQDGMPTGPPKRQGFSKPPARNPPPPPSWV